MKFIIGKKIGMTQIFEEDGKVIPVTLVEIEPNIISQTKTKEKDGYEAIQVSTGNNKKKYKREVRGADVSVDISAFQAGDKVKVTGISKGKGFQGVVKRHGFHGMPASHGHHHVLRHGGSIGQRFPQHTLKGMRMAGRMGGVKSSVRGLMIIKVDAENKILAIKGAIPGNRRSRVQILSK